LWRELTPGDDSIERFIVRHYRYDPQRRGRRHVVVAAFDNEPEFRACMGSVQEEIMARRECGEPVLHGRHTGRAASGLALLDTSAATLASGVQPGAAGRHIHCGVIKLLLI